MSLTDKHPDTLDIHNLFDDELRSLIGSALESDVDVAHVFGSLWFATVSMAAVLPNAERAIAIKIFENHFREAVARLKSNLNKEVVLH